MDSPRWEVSEYRGRQGLEALADDWRRLYSQMPIRTRYHLFDACHAFNEHLSSAPDTLRCLALSDGSRLRAICPLTPRSVNILGLAVPAWSLPWHLHWLVSDVICPEDEARSALLPAVVRHLRRQPEGRPILLLGPLPADSVFWDGLCQVRPGGVCTELTVPSSYFDCEQPFDVLMSRLTKHFRRNLRSHARKIAALADVSFVTSVGEARTAFETFMTVEASGWKGASGAASAIALHPETAAFYSRLTRALVDDDARCEINAVHAEGRCLASQFCVRAGSTYTILKIGYDETYARYGPGQVLLERTLQTCCDDPAITRLDLVTDADWCKDWHTDVTPMRQAFVAIGRLRGWPSVGLLRLRLGPARRLARKLGGRAGADRDLAACRSGE